MDTVQTLEPATARRIFRAQMAFFAVMLSAIAISNVFTAIADRARDGVHLTTWEPLSWEFSSVVCIWLLIPAIGWWVRQFPLVHGGWPRSLPAHLLATLPFSLAHVGGMVTLRTVVYRLMGSQYQFGPWWPTWLYEYRKDFVTYWLTLVCILAFRLYGLWRDARESATAVPPRQRSAANDLAVNDPAANEPRANESEPSDPAAAEAPLERLVVRKLNREYIIAIADVDRVEADGNYVMVYAQGSAYPRRESLTALEKKLDSRRFVRVHRGHLVNVDRIREIQPWDHGDYRLVLQDGTCVNLSRRYRARLQHLLR